MYLSFAVNVGILTEEAAEDADGDLGIERALQVPHDVVGGELAAAVIRHALAQVDRDLLAVAADVPALGELGLRLEVLVVPGQRVVGQPDVEPAVGRPVVAVQIGDVAEFGRLQCAARLGLRRGGRGGLRCRGSGAASRRRRGGCWLAGGSGRRGGWRRAGRHAGAAAPPHAARTTAPVPAPKIVRNERLLT